jgi:hypothetical protein
MSSSLVKLPSPVFTVNEPEALKELFEGLHYRKHTQYVCPSNLNNDLFTCRSLHVYIYIVHYDTWLASIMWCRFHLDDTSDVNSPHAWSHLLDGSFCDWLDCMNIENRLDRSTLQISLFVQLYSMLCACNNVIWACSHIIRTQSYTCSFHVYAYTHSHICTWASGPLKHVTHYTRA